MDLKATEHVRLRDLFEAFNSNCRCDLWWKLIPDLWASNRKRPVSGAFESPGRNEEKDLNRFRLGMSCRRKIFDARYEGANSLKHLKTRNATLNSILRSILSQWSSARVGVMWSYLCFLITSLGAALTTDCRRRVKVLGSPTRAELQ